MIDNCFFSNKCSLSQERGVVTPSILIIVTSFIAAIYSLLFLVSLQLDFSNRNVAREQALYIAEAGINYYRWHLAHAPEDFQDGTGQSGPYEHSFTDPQGGIEGEYSLEITPPSEGSSVVTIRSTGWTRAYPKIKRTIKAQFGKPSLAQYSFLQNASSWYGSGITVNGRIHSNNGIRMDGTNTSLVTSSQETYMCGSETGCHPPESKPGVWGSGSDQSLWQFPVPAIDFDTISFDFAQMRDAAQATGLYLGDSGASGYHVVFSANGQFSVSRVESTNSYRGYAVPGQGLGQPGLGGCRQREQVITDETLLGTYPVTDRPIIFAEDDLWVEGTVNGRVTVVAARFPISSNAQNIWIPNNLGYAAYNGSHALGLIAQNDIYFARDIPSEFRVDGALMAQTGSIIRHGYLSWCGGTTGAVKSKLTIFGSLLTYNKSYWNFGTAPDSGFITREINYDPHLLYNPPPYFPTTSEYTFISWTEE